MHVVQSGVGNSHVARHVTGTLAIQLRQNVGRTADTAVILAHAPTELHATVPG